MRGGTGGARGESTLRLLATIARLALSPSRFLPAPSPLLPSSRVLLGQPSSPGEFPWLASLWSSPSSNLSSLPSFLCTSSLVTSRHALTSSSCLASLTLEEDLSLVVGGHSLLGQQLGQLRWKVNGCRKYFVAKSRLAASFIGVRKKKKKTKLLAGSKVCLA